MGDGRTVFHQSFYPFINSHDIDLREDLITKMLQGAIQSSIAGLQFAILLLQALHVLAKTI